MRRLVVFCCLNCRLLVDTRDKKWERDETTVDSYGILKDIPVKFKFELFNDGAIYTMVQFLTDIWVLSYLHVIHLFF